MSAVPDTHDAVVDLHYELPFLWADPRTGEEAIATEWVRAPVRIRHVPLAAMATRVGEADRGFWLALVHDGREWSPFTRYSLAGLRELAAADEPPLFRILRQDVPPELRREPRCAPERRHDWAREHAVFRPADEAAIWAARRVEERLVHDGTNLFETSHAPAAVQPVRRLSERVAGSGLFALAHAPAVLRREPAGAPLHAAAAHLRRTALLARLDALPDDALAGAAGHVRDFARMLAERLSAKTTRERMRRLADDPELATAPPEGDLAALAILAE